MECHRAAPPKALCASESQALTKTSYQDAAQTTCSSIDRSSKDHPFFLHSVQCIASQRQGLLGTYVYGDHMNLWQESSD